MSRRIQGYDMHALRTYSSSYYPLQNSDGKRVHLSGYGVELAIKSQEYKAKDDTQVQGELTRDNTLLIHTLLLFWHDIWVYWSLFRGGGERHRDRGERSSGWGPGIPVWKTQVSDFMLAGISKSHHIPSLYYFCLIFWSLQICQLLTSSATNCISQLISPLLKHCISCFPVVSLQNPLSRAEGAAKRAEEAFGGKHQWNGSSESLANAR